LGDKEVEEEVEEEEEEEEAFLFFSLPFSMMKS